MKLFDERAIIINNIKIKFRNFILKKNKYLIYKNQKKNLIKKSRGVSN